MGMAPLKGHLLVLQIFFLMSTRTVKALRSLTTTFLPSKTTEPSYRGFPAEIGDGGVTSMAKGY